MKYYFKAFQNYINFDGRATRSEYWYFVLFNFIAAIIWGIFCGIMGLEKFAQLYTFATLLPSIAAGVRRMHDVGKNGWFLLIPFYNLYLACLESDPFENQYGEVPSLD